MNRIILSVVMVLGVCGQSMLGQQVKGTIEVVLERLPQTNQEKLATLSAELDRYVNNYEWCPNDYNYQVPVTISVNFEEAKATSREDRYEVRLIISNESDVQYSDYRWDFALIANPQLQHSPTFDSFTGMIDFYIYLILGYEFDRIEKLGGRDYFQKARDVLEQAKFSRFIRGWDRRETILNDILSDANQPSREMRFYYYTGIYYFDYGEMTDAQKYLVKALSYFAQLPDATMDRFYSLNYHQMGEALGRLEMKQQLELLMQLDTVKERKDYYRSQWETLTQKQE